MDKQLIPAGYKQTEVGVIPEEWEILTVEDIVKRGWLDKPLDGNHGEIHPKSGDFVSYGIPFVMANNVQGGQVDLKNCSFIRKEQADSLMKGFSLTGDVLLTHKATIGNTAVVGELDSEYIMLTPQVTYYRVQDKSKLNNYYLKHFMDGGGFQSILASMSGGGTRSYIGITAQRQLPIVLPTFDEQTAIANALSDVDALIAALEKLINKKSAIKTAAMQQLLTGKKRLPPFDQLNTGYKQTELGEIPGDWEAQTLGDIAEVRMCKRILAGQTVKTGPIPFFKIGTFGGQPDVFIPLDLYIEFREKYSFPKEGDILISAAGTLGKVVIYDGSPAYFQDSNIVWLEINKQKILNEFLFHFYKIIVWASSEGSTILRLYNGIIKATGIILPPLEEQTAIANVLSDMDKELDALQQRLHKTQQIKQGMMQELLTGKTRLISGVSKP